MPPVPPPRKRDEAQPPPPPGSPPPGYDFGLASFERLEYPPPLYSPKTLPMEKFDDFPDQVVEEEKTEATRIPDDGPPPPPPISDAAPSVPMPKRWNSPSVDNDKPYEEPKPLNKTPKQQSPQDELKAKLMKNVISQLEVKLVEKKSPSLLQRVSLNRKSLGRKKSSAGGKDACQICQKNVSPNESHMLTGDSKFHIKCVQCTHCGVEECTKFFIVNGKVYCHDSYEKLFVRKCGRCNRLADPKDLLIEVSDEVYHVDCFQCQTCSKELAKLNSSLDGFASLEYVYYSGEKELFCTEHGSRDSCAGCGDKIAHDAKAVCASSDSAERNVFHEDCFCCSTCKRTIESLGGGYIWHEGKILCEKDYMKAVNLVCAVCDKNIGVNTQYLQSAEGDKYHTKCFACSKCKKERADGLGKNSKGKLICTNCT